ncbi:hypothetical protein PHISCL_01531 [Aspergillus sclerotialis]|uniref:GH16 domain-containing protein n=1 Tax=Aspergillus sclerotialis TaxID=2070753 RepID=A0A3A3AA06_9EURO|nr:hypothetical protein PHISCL_01531 [Aspergillus sclerotialis]
MKAYFLSLLQFLIQQSFVIGLPSSRTISPSSTAPKPNPSLNKRHCDCYLVNGPDPGYFQRYEFYDFRYVPLEKYHDQAHSISNHTILPHPTPSSSPSKDIEDGLNPIDQLDNTTRLLFGEDAVELAHTPFARFWKPQYWRRPISAIAPIEMKNSIHNVFFVRDPERLHGPNSTFLVLRTTRRKDYVSAAEIESTIQNLYHSSVRIRLRIFAAEPVPEDEEHYPAGNITLSDKILPPRGACAGIFTYNSAICESDIEILTADPPNHIHYANQPDYDPITDESIPGASVVAHITAPWTSWASHRIDWLPWVSRWYQNDELLHATRYSIPDKLSMLVVNLWSDGGVWTGDLKVGENVFLGIEWIEIAYNISSKGLHGGGPVGKPDQRHTHLHSVAQTREMSVRSGVRIGGDGGDGEEKSCRRPCWVDDFHQ